jgi:membrane protease YdiL (CAAX protease family)
MLAVFVLANLFALARNAAVAADAITPETAASLSLLVPFLLLALAPVVYVSLAHGSALRQLVGAWARPVLLVAAGIGLGIAAFVVLRIALAAVLFAATGGEIPDLPELQPQLRELARDPDLALSFIVAAVVLAPVAEELVYRGMLYQALRDRFGIWPGIGLSSLIFTLLHLEYGRELDVNLLLFITVFPLSLLLAWVFERRGSLLLPIGMHAGHNLIGVALLHAGIG